MPISSIMHRSNVILRPDPSRTMIRPFSPEDPEAFAVEGHPRAERITDRVLAMDDNALGEAVRLLTGPLADRHRNAHALFAGRYEQIHRRLGGRKISEDQALVISAYFFEEYSFESAALFNPSMILHPDQSNLPGGTIRFILSLRGIGEGHVSSVTFRTGTWDRGNGIVVDAPSRSGVAPSVERGVGEEDEGVVRLTFPKGDDISETVIFPVTPHQRQGVEDLRMVRFVEDDGKASYVGTYTAYSGAEVRQEMLRDVDQRQIEMRPLRGAFAANKGMALFPRRVRGRYAMLGRQDNESIWLLYSDDISTWNEGIRILSPRHPWEFVQMGNCGSPIEIDEGWLVLTHGVGMVRSYCIGACLLDKDDPAKVLARTVRPLLMPSPAKQGGYVPNVVYSCGGLVHDRMLLLPYGVADHVTAFASARIDDILSQMA